MPANTMVIYVGTRFTARDEAAFKARLRRVAGRASGPTLFRLVVDPDPELWMAVLEDAYPDEHTLAAFLTKMIAAHPGITRYLTEARADLDSIEQANLERRRRAILEAAISLEDLAPENEPITEDSIDSPHFSPEAIEARLKLKLETK